jgi:hypothetical protein
MRVISIATEPGKECRARKVYLRHANTCPAISSRVRMGRSMAGQSLIIAALVNPAAFAI